MRIRNELNRKKEELKKFLAKTELYQKNPFAENLSIDNTSVSAKEPIEKLKILLGKLCYN